jgi:wyosine [tRNA(Phe)-imidazoG37] synthetase (radical SAM superfamily)
MLRFCYPLGNSLYIPLTSRCNSVSLPETRGPNFKLPAYVVSSLCKVRDSDSLISDKVARWAPWCNWLDCQEEESKHPLPKRNDVNAPVEDVESSRMQAFVKEVMGEITSDIKKWDALVIAGEGEPTLVLDSLIDIICTIDETRQRISEERKPHLRLVTNGLLDTESVDRLLTAIRNTQPSSHHSKLDSVSVALMASDVDEYDNLMLPQISHWSGNKRAYDIVQDFIRSFLKEGIAVEATAVARTEVDKQKVEKVALDLGIKAPVRWRPYFG